MHRPFAVKLRRQSAMDVYRVSVDASVAAQLKVPSGAESPAVLVARNAAVLSEMNASMIDADDVVALTDGNWDEAVLLVLNETGEATADLPSTQSGDESFLEAVRRDAAELYELAKQTLSEIRAAGIEGELEEAKGGRWVNRPINTFTLKAQPRAGNLQFTLYGDPDSFDAGDFLLRDQNSYSRGWVRTRQDARKLASLSRRSHARRRR